MNATKRRVLQHWPKAYRRRRCELWGGMYQFIHEICVHSWPLGNEKANVIVIGRGTSSHAAWENAQATLFANTLTL